MSFVRKVPRHHPTWLGTAAAGLKLQTRMVWVAKQHHLKLLKLHMVLPGDHSQHCTWKVAKNRWGQKQLRIGTSWGCQVPQLNQVIWGEKSLTSIWGVLIRSVVGVILLWSKYWNNLIQLKYKHQTKPMMEEQAFIGGVLMRSDVEANSLKSDQCRSLSCFALAHFLTWIMWTCHINQISVYQIV